MKKFNEFELIGIGICLLLVCIFFSIIGKEIFNLNGDYLTSATTLFAAVVAVFLYSDWRAPLNINKIYTEQTAIRMSIRAFRDSFYIFSAHVLSLKQGASINSSYIDEYLKLERSLLNNLENLVDDLKFYSYNFQTDSIDSNINIHIDNIEVYLSELNDFYQKFCSIDPLYETMKHHAFIAQYIRNRFFAKIIEKMVYELTGELAIIYKKLLTTNSNNKTGKGG